MSEPEELTGNVLGSDIPKSTLFKLRDMIESLPWEAFCVVMHDCVKISCEEILGKTAPTNEELQALSGMWKALEQSTAHFPQAVMLAVADVKEQEAEMDRGEA